MMHLCFEITVKTSYLLSRVHSATARESDVASSERVWVRGLYGSDVAGSGEPDFELDIAVDVCEAGTEVCVPRVSKGVGGWALLQVRVALILAPDNLQAAEPVCHGHFVHAPCRTALVGPSDS